MMESVVPGVESKRDAEGAMQSPTNETRRTWRSQTTKDHWGKLLQLGKSSQPIWSAIHARWKRAETDCPV